MDQDDVAAMDVHFADIRVGMVFVPSTPFCWYKPIMKMSMDEECFSKLGWDVLQGAGADLTIAGVLAGFLISAAAALLVRYDRSDPDTIALFASGVPALTLSSYLFSLLTGTRLPQDYDPNLCGQIWSQWISAFTTLLMGGSVLLCGLGWALVSYGDDLAVKLIEKNSSMRRIADSRGFFIGLNGWLSLGATTATTCWLIAANVVYLKTTTWKLAYLQLHGWRWLPAAFHVKWYAMFFVFLFGVYVMARSAYLVIWRTTTARRTNVDSCTRYVPGADNEAAASLGARDDEFAKRVARELCVAAAIALGTLLAYYLTNQTVGESFSVRTTLYTVGVVVFAYIIGRLAYRLIARVVLRPVLVPRGSQATTNRYSQADAMIRNTPSTETPEDAIRIKYSLRRLSQISYHVVCFAVLGTIFAAALTQGPLWTNWRTGLSLFIGGLYPASILLGLSYSVPAAPGTRLPEWKTWRGSRLLP